MLHTEIPPALLDQNVVVLERNRTIYQVQVHMKTTPRQSKRNSLDLLLRCDHELCLQDLNKIGTPVLASMQVTVKLGLRRSMELVQPKKDWLIRLKKCQVQDNITLSYPRQLQSGASHRLQSLPSTRIAWM